MKMILISPQAVSMIRPHMVYYTLSEDHVTMEIL